MRCRYVLLLLSIFLYGCKPAPDELVVSGRVERDQANIGSRVGGRVLDVPVREGDAVVEGQPIVLLEADEARAQLAHARAELARAEAELSLLEAGTRQEDMDRQRAVVDARAAELALRRKGFRQEEIAEAQAQVRSAESAAERAVRDLARGQSLRETGAIDQQQLDSLTNASSAAAAALDVARERLALLQAGYRAEEVAAAEASLKEAEAQLQALRNGARPEERAAARAAVEATRADVARMEVQLREMTIAAPAPSVVETLDLQKGDLVSAGRPVAVLNLQTNPYVRVYIPEPWLPYVPLGETVTIRVDGSDRLYNGVVRRIASEAQFTPRNVQTHDKRADLVFEAKVDVTDAGDGLQPGMYADVMLPRPAGAHVKR